MVAEHESPCETNECQTGCLGIKFPVSNGSCLWCCPAKTAGFYCLMLFLQRTFMFMILPPCLSNCN
uniref:Uncharacterized protein n=1 Tax=Rhizophora mucronata TaxID=61149 RepID=A0A2P2LRB8_RHIMU